MFVNERERQTTIPTLQNQTLSLVGIVTFPFSSFLLHTSLLGWDGCDDIKTIECSAIIDIS